MKKIEHILIYLTTGKTIASLLQESESSISRIVFPVAAISVAGG